MYISEVKGQGNIVARVVADSISETGKRITTFELEYHRFIHSELMTHRHFSRNAMSSRAVPVSKMIEQVRTTPATPIHWGKNQAGMQAEVEVSNFKDFGNGEYQWIGAANDAASRAEVMMQQGYHKQIVNRLLEPFQMMKTVLTATEFDNFFWLRLDSDAQPEIQELAKCMYEAMSLSKPELLNEGEWHTPYVTHYVFEEGMKYGVEDSDGQMYYVSEKEAIAISASCCGQVSYRVLNNTYEKAMDIYNKLISGSKVHASPFEHQATPYNMVNGWEQGVTHIDSSGEVWSGNFCGWVQHRQLLANHTCYHYEPK